VAVESEAKMKFEALPPSQRLWSSPKRPGTVIEFQNRLRPRDRRAPSSREHGGEIIDFTVYRLLKAHRSPPPSSRL